MTAVRGNNDRDRWAADIPETDVLEIGDVSLYVLTICTSWISTRGRPASPR